MKGKIPQKQKNRWGIKTAHIFEDLDLYEGNGDIGVVV